MNWLVDFMHKLLGRYKCAGAQKLGAFGWSGKETSREWAGRGEAIAIELRLVPADLVSPPSLWSFARLMGWIARLSHRIPWVIPSASVVRVDHDPHSPGATFSQSATPSIRYYSPAVPLTARFDGPQLTLGCKHPLKWTENCQPHYPCKNRFKSGSPAISMKGGGKGGQCRPG